MYCWPAQLAGEADYQIEFRAYSKHALGSHLHDLHDCPHVEPFKLSQKWMQHELRSGG